MANEQQEHIAKIREDFQASQRIKDSLNNSIQALANDLYSKDTHFIFELIQNAEDNTYGTSEPSLSFRLAKSDPTGTQDADGALIIQNNEIGFSPQNVDAICAVGKTTKSKMQGYIGEKGIGFKSVFRVTSNPHIFSGGYGFCLPEHDEETGLGYIVPRWIEQAPEEINPHLTTIILPLNKDGIGYAKIEEMLRDIEPETILFLSKIKEIRLKTDTGDDLSILKDDINLPRVRMSVQGERQGKSFSELDEFLLYTQPFDRPESISHEKRSGIDRCRVTIAFPLDEGNTSAGKIYAYLPVRSDTGLPFLINADFILTSSREDIQKDVPWNQWLMNCVANLVAEALPRLKEAGLLTTALLERLANSMLLLAEGSIFRRILYAVDHTLIDQELLPADDGTFVSAKNAILASAEGLRKLVEKEHIKELLKAEKPLKWISGEITERARPNLWKYIHEHLHVEVVTPASFAGKIDERFLEKQSDAWFVSFYEFLLDDHESLWRAPRWESDPGGILRGKPIIRLEKGSLVAPFDALGHSNAYLSQEPSETFQVVRQSIANHNAASDFLKRLGLTEPDEEAEIEGILKSRYVNVREKHSPNLNDLPRFIRFVEKNSGKAKLFSEYLIFKRVDDKWGNPSAVFLDSPFDETGLRAYYDAPEGGSVPKALSKEYLNCEIDKKRFVEFAMAVGVIHRLRVSPADCSKNPRWEYLRGGPGSKGITFSEDWTIERLDKLFESPTVELSRLVWQTMNALDARFLQATYQKSRKGEPRREDSQLVHLLRAAAWVPQKGGSPVKPCDATLDQLLPGFSFDEGKEWIKTVKFGETAKKRSEEYQFSNQSAQQFGFETADEAKECAELVKDARQQGITLADLRSQLKPVFAVREVVDPARREKRIEEQIDDAAPKEYEQRNRSVRTTDAEIRAEARLMLKDYYTNDDKMICQICGKEMPFRKRNREYYFEAVEALSSNHFTREHKAQFLALCPLCAAKYEEFIKNDESAMESLKTALMNSHEFDVPLHLDEPTSIRFVKSHWRDMRTILQAMS